MMNILTINQLRERKYSSQLRIEEQIKDEKNFTSYIASYDSDGLKVFGYLVIPKMSKARARALGDSKDNSENKVTTAYRLLPKASVIIFCHGRIEQKDYLPERQYARHCEYLGSHGFVVFKPDYRGHGNSEGEVETIFESGYTIDVLNALEALKSRDSSLTLGMTGSVGIMGHSLGGNIALKVMEVNSNIKAGVIWAGAVTGYDEMLKRWGRKNTLRPIAQELIKKYGEPKENPEFWRSISPINFVKYIQRPILIQHGEKDQSISSSQAMQLKNILEQSGKEVELVLYKNGTHNFEDEIWQEAMDAAVNFFANKISTD